MSHAHMYFESLWCAFVAYTHTDNTAYYLERKWMSSSNRQGCTLMDLCPCQAALTMEQGGHSAAVQCLVPIGQFLFSADWNGDIKVTLPGTNAMPWTVVG